MLTAAIHRALRAVPSLPTAVPPVRAFAVAAGARPGRAPAGLRPASTLAAIPEGRPHGGDVVILGREEYLALPAGERRNFHPVAIEFVDERGTHSPAPRRPAPSPFGLPPPSGSSGTSAGTEIYVRLG